jgi:hypothetical protein
MDLNYILRTRSATTVIVLSAAPLLYIVVRKVLHRLTAPIRDLPGPKSVNWLTGSLERHVWEPDAQDAQLDWTLKYGPVFKYYGVLNVSTKTTKWFICYLHQQIVCFQMAVIVTTDLQALNYILNAPEFDKPYADRQFLGEFAGKGWPGFLTSSACSV